VVGRHLRVRTAQRGLDLLERVRKAHADATGGNVQQIWAAPYGSDLRLMTNLADTPTLHYGPGDAALAHAPNEAVPVSEVLTCARSRPARLGCLHRGGLTVAAWRPTRGPANEQSDGPHVWQDHFFPETIDLLTQEIVSVAREAKLIDALGRGFSETAAASPLSTARSLSRLPRSDRARSPSRSGRPRPPPFRWRGHRPRRRRRRCTGRR